MPNTINNIPATCLRIIKLILIARPASPAPAPRPTKTALNPATNISEWINMRALFFLAPGDRISGPARMAIYIGARGKTHGRRKELSPATKAVTTDMLSTDLYHNIKVWGVKKLPSSMKKPMLPKVNVLRCHDGLNRIS